MRKTDAEIKREIEETAYLWLKRIYIVAGNLYSWFWIIRALFFREETPFEDYLIWFFLASGFVWFSREHRDIFFRDKNGKIL
ncbi:hypothetical protein E2605_18920 [Dysgonomonas capnocytophagoides]|uniref:2TM domain-containing protein n=1 Tax=Dysgonomonas capnocytophagoides TaxID=45254 RepID=A0A4Y8KSJ9_9BACT|nr:hypothetical protein [Dysgonomonas capnocytophagoides]TFD92178.1 hypothetical protein E2605_18920 [Dysgonomonas capnocytophagoides]